MGQDGRGVSKEKRARGNKCKMQRPEYPAPAPIDHISEGRSQVAVLRSALRYLRYPREREKHVNISFHLSLHVKTLLTYTVI